jgi:hypothetical protein
MVLIVDLQYFPSLVLYKGLSSSSNIVFEQYETYQKMSFRNRCQITGAEGLINLSVPLVKGRDQKTLIREVRISDRQPWQAQHWKTIVSCYNRSPWFEFYRDGLEQLYKEPAEFLLDWNWRCFEWSLLGLGLSIPTSLTSKYEKSYPGSDVTDWRGKILPKNRGEDMGLVPRYRQVFEERIGFIPNLSILDLLFCEGKEAIRYIRSS